MSLMLDAWPADDPTPPPPLPRRLWPWLAGVVGAVAVWVLLLGGNPLSSDVHAVAILAIPIVLALLVVTVLVRTRLPGWAIATAHLVVLPLALLIPFGVAAIIDSTGIADLRADAVLVYVIGFIWALTAVLVCGLLTAVRLLVRAARRPPEPSAARLRIW